MGELPPRVAAAAEERRSDPRDDLLTALVQFRYPDGRGLTSQVIMEICSLIIAGGDDTTTGLVANSVREHRHRQRLEDDAGDVHARATMVAPVMSRMASLHSTASITATSSGSCRTN